MQKIGQLFLLRTNINSVGSVLDSPVSGDLAIVAYPSHRRCFPGSVLGKFAGKRKLSRAQLDAFLKSYPDLQPLYDAARSYLEIPQRLNLLNTRVEVGL